MVVSPITGRVANKNVDLGKYVQPGQPLLSLVDEKDVWIVANFKETQIKKMRIGQPVDIEVDAYPGVDIQEISSMVLAMQFNSFLHPLTVMLALPLSTMGAFGALYLTGDTISIMSMIGMITLTALVVKNSILLVDYTNTLRERGMERDPAVLQASPVRLRPILMTAVTTMLGVLPVALGYSAGGEARAGMGKATFGGMFASTLLTLFVVPAAYTYTPLDNLQEKVRILSAPPAVGTRAGRQGPCLSHFGRKGHLPFNRHRDCIILVSYVSVKSINIL